SSVIPTLVSWGVVDTYNSLFISTPVFLHRTRSARRTRRSIAFSAAPGRNGRGHQEEVLLPGTHTAVNCSFSSALIALSLLSGLWPLSRVHAEGAVPRLTGFNPVRLPLRRDSALLFREGLRNLVAVPNLVSSRRSRF